jgi:hypothetical protein
MAAVGAELEAGYGGAEVAEHGCGLAGHHAVELGARTHGLRK